MTREEIYAAWVPDMPHDAAGMPWTSWSKPVMFANLGEPSADAAPNVSRVEAARSLVAGRGNNQKFAVVIDLPGPDAVARGMDFAELGFRPVPLFNGCPGMNEVVETKRLASALREGAARLREIVIDENAPPVFLLDSERLPPKPDLLPGRFDNRWLTFPQDFPSATLLLARGLTSALLIQATVGQPKDDLAHVLRRWQEAGIKLEVMPASESADTEPLDIKRPSMFRSLWYRLGATVGMYPNSTGGFGGIIPMPSSGG